MKPDVVYRDRDFLIANKPVFMPTEPDVSGDDDLLTVLSRTEGKLWLVHRLDRAVGGLLLFARTKDAAARFSRAVAEGLMEKVYLAVIEGDLPDSGTFSDYLRKDARAGRAYVCDPSERDAKTAELSFVTLGRHESARGVYSLVRVRLVTGRFHQIRAQFSARSHPLVGDGKYGSHDKGCPVALFASGLSFTDKKRACSFEKKPDTAAYPWNLFSWESL